MLEQDFEVRVLALPAIGNKKADPDLFIREKGAEAYSKALKEAPPYVDYLISRAQQMDLSSAEGKLRALNFLLPFLQRIPNRFLRSEWATRISQQMRVDEPVLRAALRKAADERRGEVKTQPELIGKAAKPIERRLIRLLVEAEAFRRELALRLERERLYLGLETEKIFAALIVAALSDHPIELTGLGALLEERDRRVFFEILFEPTQTASWEEAESCLEALKRRRLEQELGQLQRDIEANASSPHLRELLTRKQELLKRLSAQSNP